MARRYVPRPYQSLITAHILNHPRCGIWSFMGSGKTVATLTALYAMDEWPVLVIAPLRVANSVWPAETALWEHLQHLRVSAITGPLSRRLEALQRPADLYTINYENLPWLVKELGKQWPFKAVVADESTKLKSFRTRQGGSRARALAKVAHTRVSRFIELTGTPAPNGLIDLWGQLWFLDKGHRLGSTFTAFDERWFRTVRVGEDAFATRKEPLKFAQDEIQSRVTDLCMALHLNDFWDVKEPVVVNVRVDMPPDAREIYDALQTKLFAELLSGEVVEAANAASKTTKCLQAASGALYLESGGFEELHTAKLDALESILEEAAGMPLLVAYHFKSDLARLQKRFPQARRLDSDPATIDDFNAGRIPMLLAHPASGGHGLSLQHGSNIIVFFSHWWNLEEYQQVIERVGPARQAQAGYDRPVFIYHLLTRGTIDEIVLARRETKRDVQDLLMEAARCALDTNSGNGP